MKKVYAVYRNYMEEHRLVALYATELKAIDRANKEFESDKTRIVLMRDVEKGKATIDRDIRKITFHYNGPYVYDITMSYSVIPIDVLS